MGKPLENSVRPGLNLKALLRAGNLKEVSMVVSFVGHSNSGKTTLIEHVLRLLKDKGYRVGVIKHASHGFQLDREGKDSWRFSQAGADVVTLLSPERVAMLENVSAQASLEELVSRLRERMDVVLIEGFKEYGFPKIVVLSQDKKDDLVLEGEVLGTVLPGKSPDGALSFPPEDIARVAAMVEGQVRQAGSYRNKFDRFLEKCTQAHGHICPGQVLGVRMALLGCRELRIEDPSQEPKRLVVFVEIDRCATDAIQVVTGCKLGKRTMKYLDYGKVAATFLDLPTGTAVRVAAREDAREKAILYQLEGCTKYQAQIAAYKQMNEDELFCVEKVAVRIPDEDLPGPPHRRVICAQCGEGVNDGRDVMVDGKTLCRACAYGGYYQRGKVVAVSSPRAA